MNDNRNKRAGNARQTLEIIAQGNYVATTGEQVHVAERIRQSIEATVLYKEDTLESILVEAENKRRHCKQVTTIEVVNCTTMQAAEALLKEGGKTACLNFASAKNPGGGFLGGSQAQEESLARASSLYATQQKFLTELYEYNRGRHTYLYSDRMIYSPQVVFFRNDNDDLLPQPYTMDVLTAPAVNIGAMRQNKPEELPLAEVAMLSRMDKLLGVFMAQGADSLVLGAWGCGVFLNDPKDVARYFAHYLQPDGKYGRCFRKVVFAVFDRSKNLENIQAFQNAFR